jgi:hypothetical protein
MGAEGDDAEFAVRRRPTLATGLGVHRVTGEERGEQQQPDQRESGTECPVKYDYSSLYHRNYSFLLR